MIAAHLGIVDENQINQMSYVFFDDVLTEQGYKLIYEAMVNFAGNSFCTQSWDMITTSNPFNVADVRSTSQGMGSLANFFAGSKITILGGQKE